MFSQFDWNLTRNENMADISGLQIAYKTWSLLQEEHDPDPRLPGINLNARKLFFLNAAQVKMHEKIGNLRQESHVMSVHYCVLSVWTMLDFFTWLEH
jgi:predicted metalloendopeptidase